MELQCKYEFQIHLTLRLKLALTFTANKIYTNTLAGKRSYQYKFDAGHHHHVDLKMKKLYAELASVPLLTGIIGEAVLELIERSMNISREGIIAMLEKKKSECAIPRIIRVIDDALFWMQKGTGS